MPTNNHIEEDPFQDAINDYMKDLSFIRPAFDYLKDGNYQVSIHYAGGLKTSNGLMLKITGLFQDEDGDEIEDSLLIASDWKPGKPFRKLLELSNCLPGPKEQLDLEGLLGLTFLFTIKVNSKNGKDYVNLVDVALPEDEE
jgi:hypothetical protein